MGFFKAIKQSYDNEAAKEGRGTWKEGRQAALDGEPKHRASSQDWKRGWDHGALELKA